MFDNYTSSNWDITHLKWLGVGLVGGYLLKSLMPNKAKTVPTNVLYLTDTESNTLFGSLFSEGKNNYKTVYQALNAIPEDEDVNLIIQTYGGYAVWCQKICETIRNRREKGGKVRVYVQDYAFSSGSIIAMCADELYMTKNASLSAIIPSLSAI